MKIKLIDNWATRPFWLGNQLVMLRFSDQIMFNINKYSEVYYSDYYTGKRSSYRVRMNKLTPYVTEKWDFGDCHDPGSSF